MAKKYEFPKEKPKITQYDLDALRMLHREFTLKEVLWWLQRHPDAWIEIQRIMKGPRSRPKRLTQDQAATVATTYEFLRVTENLTPKAARYRTAESHGLTERMVREVLYPPKKKAAKSRS